jgi:hypothetical protein
MGAVVTGRGESSGNGKGRKHHLNPAQPAPPHNKCSSVPGHPACALSGPVPVVSWENRDPCGKRAIFGEMAV